MVALVGVVAGRLESLFCSPDANRSAQRERKFADGTVSYTRGTLKTFGREMDEDEEHTWKQEWLEAGLECSSSSLLSRPKVFGYEPTSSNQDSTRHTYFTFVVRPL